MDIRKAVYKWVTGQRRTKQTSKGLMNDAYTAHKTWKQVAAESGVSERTLRRLRNQGGKPSKATQEKLDQLAKQAQVRAAGIKPGRAKQQAKATAHGAKFTLKADQGPRGNSVDAEGKPLRGSYLRLRTVEMDLDGADIATMLDMYGQGQDEELDEKIAELITENGWDNWTPTGGWDIGDVTTFDWTVRDGDSDEDDE